MEGTYRCSLASTLSQTVPCLWNSVLQTLRPVYFLNNLSQTPEISSYPHQLFVFCTNFLFKSVRVFSVSCVCDITAWPARLLHGYWVPHRPTVIIVSMVSWKQQNAWLAPYLSVVADLVAQGDEAGLELLGFQATGSVLVKVVEGHAEFVHLVLADALRVSRQDLQVWHREHVSDLQWSCCAKGDICKFDRLHVYPWRSFPIYHLLNSPGLGRTFTVTLYRICELSVLKHFWVPTL